MKMPSKICPPLQIFLPPSPKKLPEFCFLMTSHGDSHTKTDVKPEMISGVQTGNGTPHDKYDIRCIAHASTSRIDNIFKQRRQVHSFTYNILGWGQGTCTLTKDTRRWTNSALRYFLALFQAKYLIQSQTLRLNSKIVKLVTSTSSKCLKFTYLSVLWIWWINMLKIFHRLHTNWKLGSTTIWPYCGRHFFF